MINCALKSMRGLPVKGGGAVEGVLHFSRTGTNWPCDRSWTGVTIKLIISHVISPQELLRLKLAGEFNY